MVSVVKCRYFKLNQTDPAALLPSQIGYWSTSPQTIRIVSHKTNEHPYNFCAVLVCWILIQANLDDPTLPPSLFTRLVATMHRLLSRPASLALPSAAAPIILLSHAARAISDDDGDGDPSSEVTWISPKSTDAFVSGDKMIATWQVPKQHPAK